MALTPSLSYTQRNDNKLLTITDTTIDYGTGGNIAVAAITTLTLDVTITVSDGTVTAYDQIDLFDVFGGFAVQADLVFPIDCTLLEDSGAALGTASDLLPDGVYDFVYTINTTNIFTESILVEGQIRAAVYEKLRALPVTYNCAECKTKEIMDTIFCYGLLNSLESAGYVAKNEELVNQLFVLERLVTNGSSYSW